MNDLMTKQFYKWVSKQKIQSDELLTALSELKVDNFEAFSKVLLSLTEDQIKIAVDNGDFKEVLQ